MRTGSFEKLLYSVALLVFVAGCATPTSSDLDVAKAPEKSSAEPQIIEPGAVPENITLSEAERTACVSEDPRKMKAFTAEDLQVAAASLNHEQVFTDLFAGRIAEKGGSQFEGRVLAFTGSRSRKKSRDAKIDPDFICIFYKHGETWKYMRKAPYYPERKSLFINQHFETRFIRDVNKLPPI